MPIRVLQIVTTMNRGGLETMLMNYYRHIDREKVQFDFLVHRQEEGDYEQEILSLGGNVYRVSPLNPFSVSYFKELNIFFSEHKYDIVHCHLDCMSAIPLAVAKKNGVKHRFAHAHSKSQDKDYKYPLKLLLKTFIPFFATQLFACGQEAGEWMFNGKKFNVINNAIDAKRYIFNNNTRKEKRKEFNLNNEFVVTHIGRFNYPKNHSFIIEIFNELLKLDNRALLFLVGIGDGMPLIKEKVKSLGIQDNVKFLGLRSDVPELLIASDVFLFPSIYEGVSLASIEAQASGLPCFFSDRIPEECRITKYVRFISLDKEPSFWAEQILKSKELFGTDNFECVKNYGYDICDKANWLENYYLSRGR